jgi:hypothetical protein
VINFYASNNDTGDNFLPVTKPAAIIIAGVVDTGDVTVATISACLHL